MKYRGWMSFSIKGKVLLWYEGREGKERQGISEEGKNRDRYQNT